MKDFLWMKDEGHRIKDKIVTTLRTQQTKVISLLSFILYLFIPFCGWMPNVPSCPLTPSPPYRRGGGVEATHDSKNSADEGNKSFILYPLSFIQQLFVDYLHNTLLGIEPFEQDGLALYRDI